MAPRERRVTGEIGDLRTLPACLGDCREGRAGGVGQWGAGRGWWHHCSATWNLGVPHATDRVYFGQMATTSGRDHVG